MRKISLLLALVASLTATQASADYTAKNAAGATVTFKNSGDCTAVVCVVQTQPVDSTGAAFGVTANPFFVTIGSGKVVSGAIASGAIASGAVASGAVSAGAYASGALAAGAFAAGSGVDGWDLTQGAIADAAVTAGATGSISAKLRSISRDLATIITNTGAAIPAGTASIGAIGFDPSLGKATPTFVNLALPATTTTQIVALSGTTLTYVTSLHFMASGAVNLTLKYGTGSNCGTGTTTLAGPYPLAAQAGMAIGSGSGAIMVVPAGKALCVTTDASMSGAVGLTYQQF